MDSNKRIPDDFPRQRLGAVSGFQPKLPLRKVGEQYIQGLTDDELWVRYDSCEDLAHQLVAYCQRKAQENPDWTLEFNINRAGQGLVQKAQKGVWDVTPEECDWIVGRLRQLLDAA